MTNYRGLLGARSTVPAELERIDGAEQNKPKPKSTSTTKPVTKKK
jgi:hypothetical protein